MRTAFTALMWAAWTLLLAGLFLSLPYSFGEALLIATLYLPGILALRYFVPQVSGPTVESDGDEEPLIQKKSLRIVWLLAAVLASETFLLVMAHLVVLAPPGIPAKATTPLWLLNPALTALILGAGYGGSLLAERFLDRRFPRTEETVGFISDRRKVSLPAGRILFIESRDTEVHVHAADGAVYRNKTPISRWEALLGNTFVRTQRAFLVNRSAIDRLSDPDHLLLKDGTSIPISAKYRVMVESLLAGRLR